MTVAESCRKAKESRNSVALADTATKNAMLRLAAEAVTEAQDEVLRANAQDVAQCDKPAQFIDRLLLNESRIADMAEGLKKLIELQDPVGETVEEWTVPNGLHLRKVRVPLGVLAIIYEARPNVTVDAIGLCIKTGNAIVLRGSKEAYRSNKALVAAVKAKLRLGGYDPEFIQFIDDTTRQGAEELMRCRESVDVLIPRGSAALIRAVVENGRFEKGDGHCLQRKIAPSRRVQRLGKLVGGRGSCGKVFAYRVGRAERRGRAYRGLRKNAAHLSVCFVGHARGLCRRIFGAQNFR